MVAVLSEWWLVLTTADHCGHIPDHVYTQVLLTRLVITNTHTNSSNFTFSLL